jgi:glycosyltransferase involved in cell wall biosynthesis
MSRPLVSVVTPVYNGEKYLAKCIESVLEQTYEALEYTIINNCSTDTSLDIANQYSKQDKRIKVLTNDRFVSAIDNHNIAFRQISNDSRYCKLVSADDWIYPESISKLVDLAERYPGVGIVQAYAMNDNGVRWPALPFGNCIFDGREICRLYLLGKIEFAGIPSSMLYRSSLVRSYDPFFPGSNPSADAAACLNCLKTCDFGFVHQILSFERIHNGAITAKVRELDSYLLDRVGLLLKYGPTFLTQDELKARAQEVLGEYYAVLATALVNCKGKEFWMYHHRRFQGEFGHSLFGPALAKAVCLKLVDLVFNPKQTIEKAVRRANAN